VYISCGADHIVCEPTGMTGSVGVIASVLTFGGLMDKVGVQPVTIVASGSPRKDDANDVYRVWNDADRAVVQGMLDRSYDIFVQRVMAGRGPKVSDTDRLREVLDGRVVGADEAQSLGLVDAVGYLDDAIAEAERRAGIALGSASVVRLFEPAPFFGTGLLGATASGQASDRSALLQAIAAHFGSEPNRAPMPERDIDRLRTLLTDLASPRIEYRLTY
jgi:protease IV